MNISEHTDRFIQESEPLSKYEVLKDGKIRKSYYEFNEDVVFWIVLGLLAISLFIIR